MEKQVDQMIWFALVGVRPLDGNEILPNVQGAYVNVACLAGSEIEFKSKISDVFQHHKLMIFEVDEIENEVNIRIDNSDYAEKERLRNEINEGYTFAWGAFHTFNDE